MIVRPRNFMQKFALPFLQYGNQQHMLRLRQFDIHKPLPISIILPATVTREQKLSAERGCVAPASRGRPAPGILVPA